MIAEVHGIPVTNVQKSFQRHTNRFTEGKHYSRIDAGEAQRSGLRVQTGQHGALLFTEKGYLLLVKPMKDEKSWQVQERMIDDYFAMRQALQSPAVSKGDMLVHMAEAYRAQEQKLLAIEAEQSAQKDAIIATQQTALQAYEVAVTALRGQAWMTIRQYVYLHQQDLGTLMPEMRQKAFARHLGDVCRERGAPTYKALTADVVWPEEKTYPLSLIEETLTPWLTRQASQASIDLAPRAKKGGTA
jgi:phage regulator Rha-like protein